MPSLICDGPKALISGRNIKIKEASSPGPGTYDPDFEISLTHSPRIK
jgi:hypothetical protein